MRPTDLMTLPCVIRHVTTSGADEMGDPTETTTTTTTTCELQQTSTVEDRDGGTVVVTQWVAYLPPDVELAPQDGLEVGSARFSVDGEPWHVRHPLSGVTTHTYARLREVA